MRRCHTAGTQLIRVHGRVRPTRAVLHGLHPQRALLPHHERCLWLPGRLRRQASPLRAVAAGWCSSLSRRWLHRHDEAQVVKILRLVAPRSRLLSPQLLGVRRRRARDEQRLRTPTCIKHHVIGARADASHAEEPMPSLRARRWKAVRGGLGRVFGQWYCAAGEQRASAAARIERAALRTVGVPSGSPRGPLERLSEIQVAVGLSDPALSQRLPAFSGASGAAASNMLEASRGPCRAIEAAPHRTGAAAGCTAAMDYL